MSRPSKLELQQKLSRLQKDYECLQDQSRILAKIVATNAVLEGKKINVTEAEREMIENVRQVLNSIFMWL